MDIVLLLSLVFGCMTRITAAPQPSIRNKRDVTVTDAIAYLSQYAYMGEDNPDPSMASLRGEEEYRMAISHFQAFAGLEETGELDDATQEMMAMPRCGVRDMPDIGSTMRKRRYVTEGDSWRNPHLTYYVDNWSDELGEAEALPELERAFEVWSENSGLTFSRSNSQSADIIIQFLKGEHGDGNAFDGSGGVLAHAFFPKYGGDAHFDDGEYFTKDTYSGINLFQVAAHEFGHSLGLGHSSVSGALMAPFYTGYQPNFQLHSDDIEGIQHLYGKNEGDNPITTTTTTTTTTTRAPQVDDAGNDAGDDAGDDAGNDTPVDGDYCMDGQFDAITRTDDGSTYAFRGSQFFKLGSSGVETGYPQSISSTWRGVPDNVDAALYWPEQRGWVRCDTSSFGWCLVDTPGTTFIFNRDHVYAFLNTEYQWHDLISNAFPGLPDSPDAAFVWGRNGRTYFFKGDEYYRFETHAARGTPLDSGYPKAANVWFSYSDAEHQQAITHIDTALQWSNGRTYFFVDDQYYRFNDNEFKIDDGGSEPYPRSNSQWWYGCSTSDNLNENADGMPTGGVVSVNDVMMDGNGSSAASAAHLTVLSSCLMLIAVVFIQ